MTPMSRKEYLVACVLFIIYFLNGILAIPRLSVTSDEGDNFSYAIRMMKRAPEKVRLFDDASTMPLLVFNAIPRAFQQLLDPSLKKNDGGVSDITAGRYISLLICSLIGLFIFRWSRELYGVNGGLFSLFLFVFCPNINAHAILVGTDAYAALFTLTSAYYFRKFALKGKFHDFAWFCVNIGIAQLVKQSLVLLFPFFGVLALALILYRRTLFSRLKNHFILLAAALVIVLLIINVGFLFSGSGTALAEYRFYSETFRNMQTWPFFKQIPLPLPVPFVEGFDQVKYMLSLGSGHEAVSPRSYLLGEYFTGSRWYYYTVVLLFKTPLATLVLYVAAIIYFIKQRFSGWWTSGYLLLLSFFFLVFFSLFNTSQHSVRHLLMIYPPVYILLGEVMKWKVVARNRLWAIPVLWITISYYYYFPNLISYTNELIPDKKNAYRIIAGSNIDFGQCNYYYINYLASHGDVKPAGEYPATGRYIISVREFLDLKETGRFKWLRKYTPYGHVNHCFLLFNITALR